MTVLARCRRLLADDQLNPIFGGPSFDSDSDQRVGQSVSLMAAAAAAAAVVLCWWSSACPLIPSHVQTGAGLLHDPLPPRAGCAARLF